MIADAGWPGTAVRVTSAGRRLQRRPDGSVLLTVEAGEDWDGVVAATVADGLGGLECLSGIPGRTGATPVQNVGAYGVEIADLLVDVDLYDRAADRVRHARARRPSSAWATAPARSRAAPTRSCCGCGSRCRADGDSAPIRYPELARALGVPVGVAGAGAGRPGRGAAAAAGQGHGARRRRPRHLERRLVLHQPGAARGGRPRRRRRAGRPVPVG